MSMSDLNSKRGLFNTAIDELVNEKATGGTNLQAKIEAVQTAGNELAKAVGVARAANPELPESDFFSANVAQRQAERDVVKGQFVGVNPMIWRFKRDDTRNPSIDVEVGTTIEVDWGDGNGWQTITRNEGDPLPWIALVGAASKFPEGTEYIDVKIKMTDHFGGWGGEHRQLVDVVAWGDKPMPSYVNMFKGSEQLEDISASDKPIFKDNEDLSGMFHGDVSFNGDISNWDMHKVATVDYMLHGCVLFNQPIGKWDVSNVTSAYRFFLGGVSNWPAAFNQDLSSWNNPVFGMASFDGIIRNTLMESNYEPQNW